MNQQLAKKLLSKLIIFEILVFSVFSNSATAQYSKYYDADNAASGGHGVIAVPILLAIWIWGGDTSRKAIKWIAALFIGLAVWGKVSMFIGSEILNSKEEITWLGLAIFVTGWFGGIHFYFRDKAIDKSLSQKFIVRPNDKSVNKQVSKNHKQDFSKETHRKTTHKLTCKSCSYFGSMYIKYKLLAWDAIGLWLVFGGLPGIFLQWIIGNDSGWLPLISYTIAFVLLLFRKNIVCPSCGNSGKINH